MTVFGSLRMGELADWRRQINDLYARIRLMDDPVAAWKLWHETRSRLFKHHAMSPVPVEKRSEFKEINVFSYDPAFRYSVTLRPVVPITTAVDLGPDGVMTYKSVAKTCGLEESLGSELTVFWILGYGGGLFIPFQDQSNGDTSFGGGRYIIDAIKGADLGLDPDSRLILDFNFSYNPSCAMNAAYVCPLSPPENKIYEAISAGEKRDRQVT
ncbi:DUF1684 domain-containing protein [Sneathiella marina]|uniref:DUF1684 domain-containing protein n=1 Tax=Sneathiella marina TaxID=2950108 RepID=A0ABY4W6F7_9PROT|nr:DUF1684 domain-containing protein [Sneathiella marina]USG62602.1 DUF1684 domain-containing protein [Sneathiella marina]